MKKKLSKEDKWFVIAGINLMAFGISGLALILTDALASPPCPDDSFDRSGRLNICIPVRLDSQLLYSSSGNDLATQFNASQ